MKKKRLLPGRAGGARPLRRLLLILLFFGGCVEPSNVRIAPQRASSPEESVSLRWPPPSSSADEEPLVTDRPDFTESTVTVPPGRVQLELGYTFTADDEKGVRSGDHTFPEFLWRIGLAEDVELRLAWDGWSFTEELFQERNDAGRRVRRKEHDDGVTDMSVGFKFHLLDQSGWIPDFGVITELSLPTGESSKSSGDVDPLVGLLWAYDLADRWSLAGNVNLSVPTGELGRFFQTSASVSVGWQITDVVGSYVEYFGFYPNERGRDAAHSLNGGFTFLLTNNLQLDIRAGVGLNEEADDLFIGTGLSIRF
jgi:hypothetical protein